MCRHLCNRRQSSPRLHQRMWRNETASSTRLRSRPSARTLFRLTSQTDPCACARRAATARITMIQYRVTPHSQPRLGIRVGMRRPATHCSGVASNTTQKGWQAVHNCHLELVPCFLTEALHQGHCRRVSTNVQLRGGEAQQSAGEGKATVGGCHHLLPERNDVLHRGRKSTACHFLQRQWKEREGCKSRISPSAACQSQRRQKAHPNNHGCFPLLWCSCP